MIAGGYLYSENKAEGKLEPNFFYLREGRLCWKKASNADSELGSVNLNLCKDEDSIVVGNSTPRRREGKQLYKFQVVTEASSLKLYASTTEDRQDWIKSIRIAMLGAKLQSKDAKNMGEELWSKAGSGIFELQDVILEIQIGDDDWDGPSLDESTEVAPMVKEKLAEALKNARVDTSDVNWEQRLAALSEEHEAELAEVRLSAAEQKRKVEVLEKQLEDSPFTTPASTARNPSQEAFEELLRRAQWLEKRLKEAEEREDELLEQKETSDRAQALLETQMAALSGQFQHGGSPVRLDKQVEKIQEELKDREEEVQRIKRQLKIEREEAEASFRQHKFAREEREEELKALREAARSHEKSVFEKTETITKLHKELADLKRQMRGSKEAERDHEGSTAKQIAVVVGDIKSKHQAEQHDKEAQIERMREMMRETEGERKKLAERVTELVRGSEEMERAHKRELAALEEEKKVEHEMTRLKCEEQLSDMEKLVALARAEESTQLTEARREVGEAKAKLQEAAHGLVAAQSRVCELESAKSKLQTDLDSVKEEAHEAAAVIQRLEHVIQVSREEQSVKASDLVGTMREVQKKTQEEVEERLGEVHILRANVVQLEADRKALQDQLDDVRYTVEAVAAALHTPDHDHLAQKAVELWASNEALQEEVKMQKAAVEIERSRMEREVRATLETMARDSDAARRSWKESDAGLATLTEQLERAETERDAARQELAKIRSELATEAASAKTYKEQSVKLAKQITDEAERIEELEKEKASLVSRLADQDLLLRQGEKDVARMIEQHQAFETEIADLHKENREQERRVLESTQLTNRLRVALDDQARGVAKREREFDEEITEHAAEHMKDLKDAQQEILAITEARDTALQEAARQEEFCKQLASGLENADLRVKVLEHECTTLKWKHENAEAAAQKARHEADLLRQSLNRQSLQVAELDSAVHHERIHAMKEENLKARMEAQAEMAQTEAVAAIERERRRTKELMSVVSTVWDYRGKEVRDTARTAQHLSMHTGGAGHEHVSMPRANSVGHRERSAKVVSWTRDSGDAARDLGTGQQDRPKPRGPGLYEGGEGGGSTAGARVSGAGRGSGRGTGRPGSNLKSGASPTLSQVNSSSFLSGLSRNLQHSLKGL